MNDDPKILRIIAEKNFSLTDICPQYSSNAVGATNVFCIFHDNRNSPSAKLYVDEDKDIVVLHCFAEHKTYTSYDYIDRILVQKKHTFKSVQDYLIKNLGEQHFNELYTIAEKESALEDETLIEQTITYINNLYNEHDNTLDFIECLYLEKG